MKRIVFSSDGLPSGLDDRARFKLWQDTFAGTHGSFDAVPLPDHPFSARAEFLQMDRIILGRHSVTTRSLSRTRQQIAAAPSEYYGFSFNRGAAPLLRVQRGDERPLAAGGATFQSFLEPLSVQADAPSEWLSIMIRRETIRALVPGADDLIATPFDTASPSIRMLRKYVAMLLEVDGLEDEPPLLGHAATTLTDLVALALGAKGDAAALAGMRGLRAARARAILHEIRGGFADPAFSPRNIAAKLALTPNYVQKLLHETGQSFTERVLELRLQRARAMLTDPRHAARRVGEIAYLCGFNEPSYFNRCFRRRFGAAPTQLRGGAPEG
jgi:AraC-like DNA-binding protein